MTAAKRNGPAAVSLLDAQGVLPVPAECLHASQTSPRLCAEGLLGKRMAELARKDTRAVHRSWGGKDGEGQSERVRATISAAKKGSEYRDRLDAIVAAYAGSGMTQQQVAEIAGCTQVTVSRSLQRQGIKL